MREWNGNEIERNDVRTMTNNQFDNALVVMSNLIARATTKWTLEETKLFLCSVTKIRFRDENNWVTMSKKDIQEKLDIKPTNGIWMRETFKKMIAKSYVQFNGKNDTDLEWHDGFVMYEVKSTKKDISVKFNETYIPFFEQLSNHFTEFYLDYVKDFTRLSSYNLYVYLCSWHDANYAIQNKKIKKSELHTVFNLKESDYWRNYGKENAKFDWVAFEKKVLNPAIKEINELGGSGKCDMYIESCEKVKKGKFILGYDIKYCFVDKDGFRK